MSDSLRPQLRPGSGDNRMEQRDKYPFDAFTTDQSADPRVLELREGWKLKINEALDSPSSTDLSGQAVCFVTPTASTNITSGAVIDLDTAEKVDTLYTFDSVNHTVEFTEAGEYFITFYITTEISSGTARSDSVAYLETDKSGSWASIPHSKAGMYNRTAGEDLANASVTIWYEAVADEKIRLYGERNSGTDTIVTKPDFTGLLVSRARGVKGDPGADGADGAVGATGPAELEWSSTQTYGSDYIVSYNGVLYISLVGSNLNNQPDTSPAQWAVYLTNPVLDIQTDTTNRTFTSKAIFRTWDAVTLPAGSKILYHTYFPHRNDDASWGGGYFFLEYTIDGGTTWENMGRSGYDLSMVSGGDAIGSYSNTFFLDFSSQTSDFDVQFRWQFQSYNGTLSINQSTNTASGTTTEQNADQYFAKQIIQQVNGVKGEQGPTGPAGPAEFEWDSTQTYNADYIVSYGGILYISLVNANLNNQPDSSPTEWSVYVDTARYATWLHKTASGVGGGTITAGAWRTGPYNYEQFNNIPGSSLNTSTGEFTLPAGKFYVNILRSVFYTNGFASRLYDVTNGTTALPGMRGYADQGDGYNNDRIPIVGVLEPASPTTYAVQVWPQTTRSSDGWGFNANTYGGEDGTWGTITVIDLDGLKGEKGDPGIAHEWDSGTTYADNAVVLYSSKVYFSLQGSNLNKQPDTETAWWKEHVWTNVVWTSTEPAEVDMEASTLYLVY